MNLITNQTKYGQIKAANFITEELNHGQKKYIKIYSTHNEGKDVFAEIFIRTFNNKIYKYVTSISKNIYIDKLDDIVDKYNDTYYRTIRMSLLM